MSVYDRKCNNFRNQNKTVTHDYRFVTNKLNFSISIFLHSLLYFHMKIVNRMVLFGLVVFISKLVFLLRTVHVWIYVFTIRSLQSYTIQQDYFVYSSVYTSGIVFPFDQTSSQSTISKSMLS